MDIQIKPIARALNSTLQAISSSLLSTDISVKSIFKNSYMPSQNIEYLSPHNLLVISEIGKIKQLHTPIKAICIKPIGDIGENTTIYIDAIGTHKDCRICYRIYQKWFPYYCFRLI